MWQVQNLIERCLQLYMSQKEVVGTLLQQAKIEPGFTELGRIRFYGYILLFGITGNDFGCSVFLKFVKKCPKGVSDVLRGCVFIYLFGLCCT